MFIFQSIDESVGIRRELVANCVHTADSDATQLDSCVASAVCSGLDSRDLCMQFPQFTPGYRVRIYSRPILTVTVCTDDLYVQELVDDGVLVHKA